MPRPTAPAPQKLRRWLALPVVVGLGGGGAVATAAAPDLGLWAAAVPLGGAQGTQTTARGDLVAGWLSALSVGIHVDDATAAWLQDLRDCILELDLHRTWSRLPDVEGDQRRVHVAGRNQGAQGYTLRLGGPMAPPRRALGDLDGYAGLAPQPWEGDTAFSSDGRLSLATHPIGHPEARGVAGALLQALDDATRGAADPDAALRARLRADFPATSRTLDRFLTFERWGRTLSDDVLLIDVAARVDPDRLAAAGLPALARFVRRMGDVADLSLTVRSRHGELGTIWARSPGSYGVRFATRDGALVPTSGGTPQLEHALDVAALPRADLALRPRGVIRLKGTRLSVDHWTVPLRYRVTDAQARLLADVRTLPDVDFRSDGGVAGWMVATAGNAMGLESHALRFFESVAEGPDGPDGVGSTVAVTMRRHGSRWTIDGDWSLRMLDNLVVRFAAQVLGHRIVPDDAVLDELLSIEGDLVAALAQDWSTARDAVASAAQGAGGPPGAGGVGAPDAPSSGSR